MKAIQPGDLLIGPFWPERVKVITVHKIGDNQVKIAAVGIDTKNFYDPILSAGDIEGIDISGEKLYDFAGNGKAVFLYLESHRIRNAFQFDPLYAVNVSQIAPLPHQIDAVYHHILTNPKIRFMLADGDIVNSCG